MRATLEQERENALVQGLVKRLCTALSHGIVEWCSNVGLPESLAEVVSPALGK